MCNVCIDGTVALFVANFLGKIFGAVYRIPLSHFLGTEGMGLYQMAFPIYSFLLTILTGGVSILLTKKIAYFRANGSQIGIYKNYTIAKRLSLLFGFLFLLFILIFAYPLSYLQGNTNAFWGYIAISFGFVFAGLLGAYRGFFQGYGKMMPTAISSVIEQIIKLVLGIVFASTLVKYGVIYGVVGALFGVSISEFASFVYFKLITKKIKKKKIKIQKAEYLQFFKDALPIGATYGILPLSSLIDSFLIVNLLGACGYGVSFSTSLYGIETGMILPLINMPNILISAIAITSVSDISYKIAKGEDISKNILNIFKTVYIFIIPCMVGLFVLARGLIGFIYPNLNPQMIEIATKLLRLSVFEMFFLCFVAISNAILQALGQTKTPFNSLIFGIIIKTCLIVLLVPNANVNIFGYVLASICGYFVSAIFNLYKIRKKYMFRFNIFEIMSPLVSCFVMTGLLVFMLSFLKNGLGILSSVFVILISALVYFVELYLLGQLNLKEIKNVLQKTLK